MRVLAWVLLSLTPAVVFRAVWAAVERWACGDGWGRHDEPSAERSLELLVADLRRLEDEFRRTESAEVPYRGARLKALSLAYDDTLRACCRLLDLPEPDRPPWTPVTRLQIEAELARAGLDW